MAVYDNYGRKKNSMGYRNGTLEAYRITVSGDVTYIVYGGYETGAVRRITKSGDTTVVEWAYGSVANKENLTYHPINDDIETEE